MPITESSMSQDAMQKAVSKGLQCAECGARLSVAWGGSHGYNSYILRCVDNIEHTGIRRDMELRPDQVPGFNLFEASKWRRKKMEQKHGQETMKAVAKYQTSALITRDAAREIVETLWKGAPATEKTKAIILCATYNLNPLMNHVFMLPFNRKDGGKDYAVVIGIEATRLLAHRRHNFTYLDLTPRRATKDELEKILGDAVDPKKLYFITKIKDLDTGAECYGLGSWEGPVYGADKGNSPANMGCIHSERQALKRQYPADLPTNVDVVDERFVEGSYRKVDEGTGEIVEVIEATGEIKESKAGEPPVVETVKPPEPPLEAPESTRIGFIDTEWLTASMKTLGWKTEKTLLTWMASKIKGLDMSGKLSDVLARMTKEQAEVFTKELQSVVDLK